MKRSRLKKVLIVTAAVAVMLFGIYLSIRPLLADLVWAHSEAKAVEEIARICEDADEAELDEIAERAAEYNEALATHNRGPHELSEAESVLYRLQMNLEGLNDTIGAIEIPKLGLVARVLYGTSETTLMAGVGHCEWSSLPVGGPSTHCVLSGHSGMEDCRMFDNLADLETGDHVFVTALGKTIGYEVTSKETVLPSETESLGIQEGKDLLTLVTCVPYGVNSHRLLVHCERCGHLPEESDGFWPEALIVPAARTVPAIRLVPVAVVVAVVAALIISLRRKKSIRKDDKNDS